MVLRNLERQPLRAGLSIVGMAFAVAILIVGMFSLDVDRRDSSTCSSRSPQRQDFTVTFVEPRSMRALYEPGTPAGRRRRRARADGARRGFASGTGRATLAITGLMNGARLNRIVNAALEPVPLRRRRAGPLGDARADPAMSTPATRSRSRCSKGTPRHSTSWCRRLVNEYMGMSVYMEIDALRRLMREGPQISGAFAARRSQPSRGASTPG